MKLHRGRLIDHVGFTVKDLEASKSFYRSVLSALGLGDTLVEGPEHFYFDELWFDTRGRDISRVHLAFQAPDREAVEAFHRAALGAGGRDNGAPGERAYHPGYYAAFAFDPDGNNVEAVFHGPAKRSATSVVVTAPQL